MFQNSAQLTNTLSTLIETKKAHVVVVGLGYVGLPTARHYVQEGYQVTGYDVSSNLVNSLSMGVSHIKDIDNSTLISMLDAGFNVTNDENILGTANVIVICVPTPIDDYKQPDLSYVAAAGQKIAKLVQKDTLIILESTTFPGTTEQYIADPLKEMNYLIGEDIFVAYSPERIDPGNENFSLSNTPKVVGGMTKNCLELVSKFVGDTSHPVDDIKVAELAKVYENTFRWINIALVNEMAQLANKLEIDIWNVLDAANSKPYGFMRFNPGIGVGGHCIPVDPYYLSYVIKKTGGNTKMIDLSGEINDGMVEYVYYRIIDQLNSFGIALSQARITVIGAAYKKNIGDLRESPVVNLVNKLSFTSNSVEVIDPYVNDFPFSNPNIKFSRNINLDDLKTSDLVVIATAHDNIDMVEVLNNSKLLFDTQNVYDSHVYEQQHVFKL